MSYHEYSVDAESATAKRILLIWDAPNLDMGLGSILGGRPTAVHRPRFDALGRWLLLRALDAGNEYNTDIDAEATVFTNITPNSTDNVRPWVEALRNVGFAVFAKPKTDEHSDVDADMLAHIAHRADQNLLYEVIVASADGQAFREPLEELDRKGVKTTVVGFREHASWAVSSDVIDFLDLEDIDGVFQKPLPRISLDNLPSEGAWLVPFRPLTALLHQNNG